MNPILNAYKVANELAKTASHKKNVEELKAELTKLDKKALVEMLVAQLSQTKVTVESVAKPILENADCAFLTYEDIATVIREALGTNTSHKSIADYASKRDWNVVPRKSQAERKAALAELYNTTKEG